jgi:hypothetical protein
MFADSKNQVFVDYNRKYPQFELREGAKMAKIGRLRKSAKIVFRRIRFLL